jgi:hypothetical protein
LIGTPASIRASVEPQTEPIDEEPFDSSVSETIRIVSERALRERAVADVTPLRAAHEARLPDREGREVVVVHEAAVGLEREVVDPLPLLRRAERREREHLRLAALEQAGAVRARAGGDLAVDRADLVGGSAVGPALLDRDLLAHEVLVDRLGGLLDVALRERVLHSRGLAVRRRRPHRERQLDSVDDPVEQQVPLRRLQLLRVVLGVGERPQVALELLPHRALDGGEALLLEQHREARLHLHLALDVLVARLHRQLGRELGEDLVLDRAGLAEADLLDALPHRVAVRTLDLGGDVHVEPLRLARLPAQVLLRLAELADLLVSELERLEEDLLLDLARAGLDHRQAVLRADDDQVERRLLEILLVRGVDDELAVDAADADGADGAEERQRREHQRRRGAVDAEDVVRGDQVGGERGADHLHLVPEALRPERPDRAVDHPGRERRPLGRAALALEEAARDLPGGVGPLLDVDGEREEVRALPRLGAADGRREDHRVAAADDDGAVRLLGQLARLEGDLLAADLDGRRGNLPQYRAHTMSSTLLGGEWKFGPAPRGRGSSKLPLSRVEL